MGRALVELISEAEIAAAVQRLAAVIDQDYQQRSPIVVGVLKGSFIFLADLVRQMQTPIQTIEFMRLSSYGSATVSRETKVVFSLAEDLVQQQDVLLVEDIVDTGRSTAKAIEMIKALQPASLKLCALLDKPDRRQVPVTIDYLGITIPDRFIVGYGLDVDEQYRQLPAIYAVEEVP